MMFVDTGAFVGRYRRSDAGHALAVEGWSTIRRRQTRCFTTPLVFMEAARLLRPYAGAGEIARLLESWFDLDLLTILRSDQDDERQAIDLMRKYADQDIGFVDCVSFVLMRRHRLMRAFSFDRHFSMAGFELWPAGIRGKKS